MLAYQIFAKRLRRALDQALHNLFEFVGQEEARNALKNVIEKAKKSLSNFEKMLKEQDNPIIEQLIPQQPGEMANDFKAEFAKIDLSKADKFEKQLIDSIYASVETAFSLSLDSSLKDLQQEVREKLFDSTLEELVSALKQADIQGPSCFISYAWGDTAVQHTVHTLAQRLVAAGINVVLDVWHNRTNSIIQFTGRVYQEAFVLVMGSQLLKQKYESPGKYGSYVREELEHIGVRIKERPNQHGVIKALVENPAWSAFPDFLKPYPHDETDFTNHLDYFKKFFNLLSLLYVGNQKALACLDEVRNSFIQQSDVLNKLTLEKLQPYLVQEPTEAERAAIEQALHLKLQKASANKAGFSATQNFAAATSSSSSSSFEHKLGSDDLISQYISGENEMDPLATLFIFIKSGSLDDVKNHMEQLKKNNEFINICELYDQEKETVLTAAIKSNRDDLEKIQYFTEMNEKIVCYTNEVKNSILHMAVKLKKSHVINFILKKNIKGIILAKNQARDTAIDCAISSEQYDVAKLLFGTLNIAQKIQLISDQDDNLNTMLHRLLRKQVSFERIEPFFNFFLPGTFLQEILEKRNNFGRNLLYQALFFNNKDAVFFLIRNGASVTAVISSDAKIVETTQLDNRHPKYFHGATILHCATGEILKCLLKEHSKKLRIDDNNNYYMHTPLHAAAIANDLEKARVLIEYGASVIAKDFEGMTSLHLAAMTFPSSNIIPILVEHMPLLLLEQDQYGMTALHWAKVKGVGLSVKMLLKLANEKNLLESMCKIEATSAAVDILGGKYNIRGRKALELLNFDAAPLHQLTSEEPILDQPFLDGEDVYNLISSTSSKPVRTAFFQLEQEEEDITRDEETALESAEISSNLKKRRAPDELPQMTQSSKKPKDAEEVSEPSDSNVNDALPSASSSTSQPYSKSF